MANTYVDYTATAAQTDFAFTFPYLEDAHVVVEIDGVQKTLTTDYTISTSPSTKIVLTSGATAGQIVRVRRKSQPDTDLVDFVNGSVLTETELDRAYLHNRYLNEEIQELNEISLQKEVGGTDWDADNAKIKNVGTPTLTADATTKQYVDDKVNQVSSGASSPPTKWVFTGTAGAGTTYSVTDAEVSGDTAYDVSIDGAVKEPTTDYTVDPDTDTLTIVGTLAGGEDIVVIERGFGIAITGTIGSSQLQSNAVTTAKIADDAVTTDKIADDSISLAKMKANSVDSDQYVDGSIDTVHIADNQVTAVKISNTDSKFNVQTDGKIGIGTTSPATALNIAATQNASSEYNVLRFTDLDTAVVKDQLVGRVEFATDDTSNPGVNAQINAIYEGSGGGADIQFKAGVAGSLNEVLRISADRNVTIGGEEIGADSVNVIGIHNGTPPSISRSDMVHLYAEDVASLSELRVRDEAGNVTTLSPHAKDAPDSLYDRGKGVDEMHRVANHFLGTITFTNVDRRNNLLQKQLNGEALPDDKTFTITETFQEYNDRTGANLVVEEWDSSKPKPDWLQ